MIDRSQVYVSLRSTKAVSSVVAAALLVVACGSRTGTESSSVTGGSAAAPGSAPDSVAIEAELGFGSREYGLTDAQWTSTVELVQTEIASCMANAGFEYIPADVATVELAMSAVRTDPGVSRHLDQRHDQRRSAIEFAATERCSGHD